MKRAIKNLIFLACIMGEYSYASQPEIKENQEQQKVKPQLCQRAKYLTAAIVNITVGSTAVAAPGYLASVGAKLFMRGGASPAICPFACLGMVIGVAGAAKGCELITVPSLERCSSNIQAAFPELRPCCSALEACCNWCYDECVPKESRKAVNNVMSR